MILNKLREGEDSLDDLGVGTYHIFETNKYGKDKYTYAQAEKLNETLENCGGCIDCSYCVACKDCTDCITCSFCTSSTRCVNCRSCDYCIDCTTCNYCTSCKKCNNCEDCQKGEGFVNYKKELIA
jgi:hypothetical protein